MSVVRRMKRVSQKSQGRVAAIVALAFEHGSLLFIFERLSRPTTRNFPFFFPRPPFQTYRLFFGKALRIALLLSYP